MVKTAKLFPGVGAKCTILTRFIHPRVLLADQSHRTTVELIQQEQKTVSRKQQECFVFRCLDGPASNMICHSVKNHLVVTEEGNRSSFFNIEDVAAAEKQDQERNFVEPKVKWQFSKAKEILNTAIIDGIISEDATDDNGNPTLSVEAIYLFHEEFAKYSFEKFGDRLARVRADIKRHKKRAVVDLKAFVRYKENNPVSLFSRKGYGQWQGSIAQEYLLIDIGDNLHITNKPKALWESRPEYYESFPLDAFRDKIDQEIKTAKYLHTLKVKGNKYKAS